MLFVQRCNDCFDECNGCDGGDEEFVQGVARESNMGEERRRDVPWNDKSRTDFGCPVA